MKNSGVTFFSANKIKCGFDAEHIHKLIDFLDEAITESLSKLEKYMNEYGEKQTNKLVEYYKPYEEDYWRINEIFSQKLRYSILITIYSYFEKYAKNICDYLAKTHDTIHYKQLYGPNIEKYRLYLEKILKIDIPTSLEKGGPIEFICYVRNDIVHNNGEASERTRQLITNNYDYSFRIKIETGRDILLVSSDFLKWAVDEARLCIEFIIENIMELDGKEGSNLSEV